MKRVVHKVPYNLKFCETCGVLFDRRAESPTTFMKRRRFCSNDCSLRSMCALPKTERWLEANKIAGLKRRGRKLSQDHIRKQIETTIRNGSQKGPRNPMYGKKPWNYGMKGLVPWNKGKAGCAAYTPQVRKKMSDAKKGERNPWWKGGITPFLRKLREIPESRAWRAAVLIRDLRTCQQCKTIARRLHCHHIISLEKIVKEYSIKTIDEAIRCSALWDVNNGVTLCIPCHKKTDTFARRERTIA